MEVLSKNPDEKIQTTEHLIIGYFGLQMLKVIEGHQEQGLTQLEIAKRLQRPDGRPLMNQDMFERTHFRLANWGVIAVERGINKWRCTDLGLNHIGKGKKSLQDQNSAVQ